MHREDLCRRYFTQDFFRTDRSVLKYGKILPMKKLKIGELLIVATFLAIPLSLAGCGQAKFSIQTEKLTKSPSPAIEVNLKQNHGEFVSSKTQSVSITRGYKLSATVGLPNQTVEQTSQSRGYSVETSLLKITE
jgi:hypothetical protein